MQLYECVCIECKSTGKVRHYSNASPKMRWIQDLAETYQEEDCPGCWGEGSFWFDEDGDEWIRRKVYDHWKG